MKNVIYFSPRNNRPCGGVKVIHRHSELLCELGVNSSVYYTHGVDDRVDWFAHNAAIKSDGVLDPSRDFVVIPESNLFSYWSTLRDFGVGYAIFVQNGYLIAKGIQEEHVAEAYRSARLIICISQDVIRCITAFLPEVAHKIIRVTYSVDTQLFQPAEKEKLISYMPRKMSEHSSLLVGQLKRHLPPGWEILPIHGAPEVQVASILSRSRIFLAFSDFEGLPVPPVEAGLSGNFVIGYSGQGGNEYWQQPVFTLIDSGDIVGFFQSTLSRVRGIDERGLRVGAGDLAMLRRSFSRQTEMELLSELVTAINAV